MRLAHARQPRDASLLERAAAYLVDSLVTAGIWLLLAWALTGGDLGGLQDQPAKGALAAFFFLLVPFVYFVMAESIAGTTPGKRLLGLHVRSVEHGPPGLFAVTVRNVLRLAWALGPLGPFLLALDALLVQQTERDQRVGDLAAKTRVVREGQGGAGPVEARFVYPVREAPDAALDHLEQAIEGDGFHVRTGKEFDLNARRGADRILVGLAPHPDGIAAHVKCKTLIPGRGRGLLDRVERHLGERVGPHRAGGASGG